MYNYRRTPNVHDKFPKRIPTKDWNTKPPCAVIVTIYKRKQSSFDNLYREIEPQSPDPESSIALFEMNYKTIPYFLMYMRDQEKKKRQAQQPAVVAPEQSQQVPSESTDDPAQESEPVDGGHKKQVEENDSSVNDIPSEEPSDNRKTVDLIQEVFDAISQVQADSVVFNFECCEGCSERGFPRTKPGGPKRSEPVVCQPVDRPFGIEGNNVTDFVRMLIDRGFMAVFGDFTLKALIKDWDDHTLGANPFQAMPHNSVNSSMLLAFDSQELLRCPSSQLQMLGRLNDGINTATLHCMSGTVVCTLKEEEVRQRLQESLRVQYNDQQEKRARKNRPLLPPFPEYEIGVLSIATEIDGSKVRGSNEQLLSVGKNPDGTAIHKGYLGHAIIKYNHTPNAGSILVSAGHWIELTRVGATDEEKILNCMKEQYGEEYRQQLEEEFNSCSIHDKAKRSEIAQRSARQLVQSCTPSNYSKRGKY